MVFDVLILLCWSGMYNWFHLQFPVEWIICSAVALNFIFEMKKIDPSNCGNKNSSKLKIINILPFQEVFEVEGGKYVAAAALIIPLN